MDNQHSETSVAPSETSESTVSVQKKKGAMNNILIGIAIVLVFGGIAYFIMQSGNNMDQQDSATAVEDIDPSAVVARVNGTELYGKNLTYQMLQVAQIAGIPSLDGLEGGMRELIEAQALDAIVNTELLVQTAESEGLAVSDEEVEAEYQSIVASVGGPEVAHERLAQLGITEEAFKVNLQSDLMIRKYIDGRIEPETLVVTEEEVQNFYDEVSSDATEEVPPLEDVRFQIEEQLQFEKEQDALSSLIEILRQGADIEILIEN